MKRTLISLVIVMCAVSFVLAATQATQAAKTSQTAPASTTAKAQAAKPAHKIFKGILDGVTLADAAKGTKSEIVVVNTLNPKVKITFLVKSTTTITDTEAKPLTLDKLQKGEKVRVSFATTAENVHEARSIHLVK